MLGKLIKHEFRATARTFLPCYAALIIVAIFNRVLMMFDAGGSEPTGVMYNLMFSLGVLAFVVLICAISVLTLVVMIQRFHKNLLGEQGYLMLTLPVKPWQHITSKLIVSIAWEAASIMATIVAALILMANRNIFSVIIKGFKELWAAIQQYMTLNGAVLTFEIIILIIAAVVFSSLLIYFAIALGHLSNKNRLLAAFGWYALTVFVLQVVGTFGAEALSSALTVTSLNNIPIHAALWISIASMVVPSVIFFWGTNRVITKRLNLE